MKGPDVGNIAERKTAEDGIKWRCPEHVALDSDGSYFQLQSK